MRITVVVPSYNRGSKLKATLEPLLRSDIEGIDEVEIIVVDDGSPTPLQPIVSACTARPPFSLRCIWQANAGPAAARNRGFRESRGDIVLFIDDDIICPPDLIRQHVAAHRKRPGSVICGRCPFIESQVATPLLQFMDSLGHDIGKGVDDEFIEISIVASGQLSVERASFGHQLAVYRDDLATPAAEEFELSMRLRQLCIPVLLATRIVAGHDHPVELEGICRQAFKHAIGYAEAAAKYPDTLLLPELQQVLVANCPSRADDSGMLRFKKAVKRSLSKPSVRKALLGVVTCYARLFPEGRSLQALYRGVIGLHFFAGVRHGIAQYTTEG